MKRTFFCMVAVLLLCVVLCGCGAMGTNRDHAVVETPRLPQTTPDVIPDILPEVSPLVTPDVEDGRVQDTDGIIQEGDTGRTEDAGREDGELPTPASPEPKTEAGT